MSELFNLMYSFAKIIGGLGLVLWAGFALTNTPMNQWVDIMAAIGVAVFIIEVIKLFIAFVALALISWKPEWFQD